MKGNPGELVLGRYRLEHPIGEGGFAKVFLGRQVSLDREVAIKAARPDIEAVEATRERFRREALLVAGINHPNVVTYHDFGVDDDGDLVLVLEHLRGHTLREVLLRKTRPEVQDVVRWIRDAAAGLGEAHARGIVHRDVKPSNLFLVSPGMPDERLKVLDFGILRVADDRADGLRDLTRTDAVIGTPDYLAPEAILGMPLDGRCDQYALALVACELLGGRRPFPPANQGGVLDRLTKRPADLEFHSSNRQVPRGLSEALHRALSPAPEERFPTIRGFADALVESVRESAAMTEITPVVLSTDASEDPGPAPGTARIEVDSEGRRWLRPWLWVAALVLIGAGAYGATSFRSAENEASTPEAAIAAPTARGPHDEAFMAAARVPEMPESPQFKEIDVASPAPSTGQPAPIASEPSRRRPPARPSRVATTAVAPAEEAVGERGFAALTLNAQPWAEVFVDGRPIGRTPLLDVSIQAGRRAIEFRHPSMKSRRVVEDVRAGERRTITIRLDPASSETR